MLDLVLRPGLLLIALTTAAAAQGAGLVTNPFASNYPSVPSREGTVRPARPLAAPVAVPRRSACRDQSGHGRAACGRPPRS